jgi:hypothetical protein
MVYGPSKRKVNTDTLVRFLYDILETVFQATGQIGEYLIVADMQFLVKCLQGFVSGHLNLLSA